MHRRLGEQEGQNSLLRARMERAEREKRDLATRVAQQAQPSQAAAGSGGNALAAHNAAELQRQLDTARQQLAHREQEVGVPGRYAGFCGCQPHDADCPSQGSHAPKPDCLPAHARKIKPAKVDISGDAG